ncbi:MAG: YihA family ribosome biogenesis GTP-binding protein, partial [Panacagrimonas sp.]
LGFGAAKNQLLGVRKALRDVPVQAQVQLFSGLKRQGVEEARSELMQMLGVDWCDRLDRPGRTPQG